MSSAKELQALPSPSAPQSAQGSGAVQPRPPERQEQAPLQLRAVRAWLGLLGWVAPGAAGRTVTDIFLRSRQSKKLPPDSTPLGAQRLAVQGRSAVKSAYRWGKEGPRVLLVHGWGTDSSSMYGLARILSEQGLCVVAFDAPAHGISPGMKTTMLEFVTGVGDVLDTVGRVHAVVGHSLGGVASVAAISLAESRRPERLVLLSSPCTLSDTVDDFARYLHLAPGVVKQMRAELLRRNGVPVEHWDIRTLGHALKMPALVIHDRDDIMVPFTQAEKVLSGLATSRLETTLGLGHRRILMDKNVQKSVSGFIAAA